MKRFVRKLLSPGLVLCIVFSICTAVTVKVYADEVNQIDEFEGHWAGETLSEWVKLGLLKGDSNGNHNPDKEVSRAEFMALVNRVMNYTAKSDSIKGFIDVSPKKWYYDEAAKALNAGYITGTAANKLSPEDAITREQAITIISRIKGINPNSDIGILSKVSDSTKLSGWAKGPVAGAIQEGLVTGSNGRVSPRANTTRSEAVVILDRLRTDTKVYCFSGTYGPESGTATAGNVVIASSGIKLRNMIVTGNLEILEAVGDGEATLDNVIVNGKLVAKGGSPVIIAATDVDSEVRGDADTGGSIIPSGGGSIIPSGGGSIIPSGGGSKSGGGSIIPSGGGSKSGESSGSGGSKSGGSSGSGGSKDGGSIGDKGGGSGDDKGDKPSPRNTYYIRQGAGGTNNGIDWNNALTELPDVLERGATYYIASGTYPSYKFDDPEQGNAYIEIKKATVDDYGTDVGWKNGYAAGVALFTDDKGPIFQFSTGYYIIDGQTGSEDSGHGIKLYNPMNIEPHKGGNCMQIPTGTQARHLTLRHIEMEDAGWAGSAKDEAYKTRTVYATGATAHITFQYCYIHESGQEWMLFSNPKSDFLVEHCYFKNGGSGSSDYHSVGVWHRSSGGDMNIHIRYNTFENFAATGGTGYISLGYRGDPDTPTYSSGYYIYGNVFKETSSIAGPSRAIGSNGANGGPFLSDVRIYNNVFYQMRNRSGNITLANEGDNNLVANNIWYKCDRDPSLINIEEDNNIKNDLTYDPFIDAANGDFGLSRELPGGMELNEPFNKDREGTIRGKDNVLDSAH